MSEETFEIAWNLMKSQNDCPRCGESIPKGEGAHIQDNDSSDHDFYCSSCADVYQNNDSEFRNMLGKSDEKGDNAPTNPGLWSQAKSKARSKFKVYPSAYANGWAAKWYKSKGGGWKKKGKKKSKK